MARIEALTHLTRSPTAVRSWMHKNGLKFRKMGHLPAKVDVAKQGQWLAEQPPGGPVFSTAITTALNNFSQEELDKALTLKFQTFENAQFYPV